MVMYIAALPHSLGALLAQHNEGKEVSLLPEPYVSGSRAQLLTYREAMSTFDFCHQETQALYIAYEVWLIARADPIRLS